MPISDLVERTIKEIVPLDETAMAAARARQDQLTKPLGSLGRLEEMSVQLAGIFSEATPVIRRKTVILAAGDHGASIAAFLGKGFALPGHAGTLACPGFGDRYRVFDDTCPIVATPLREIIGLRFAGSECQQGYDDRAGYFHASRSRRASPLYARQAIIAPGVVVGEPVF